MSSKKYNYNKDFFEEIDTEAKAYWLGFLYADGSITRFYRNEKIKSMSVELSLQSRDVGHLHDYLNSLDSNVPIQTRKHKLGDKVHESKRVVVNCTKMCRDLIKQGCTPQKSLVLEFPTDDILHHSLKRHFIRGYFDGDGCVHYSENKGYHKKNKELVTKSFVVSIVGTPSFLESIKKELETKNIKSSAIKNGNNGKAFEIRIHGKDNLKKFHDYMYQDSKHRLKRKKEIFEYAFKRFNLPS